MTSNPDFCIFNLVKLLLCDPLCGIDILDKKNSNRANLWKREMEFPSLDFVDSVIEDLVQAVPILTSTPVVLSTTPVVLNTPEITRFSSLIREEPTPNESFNFEIPLLEDNNFGEEQSNLFFDENYIPDNEFDDEV